MYWHKDKMPSFALQQNSVWACSQCTSMVYPYMVLFRHDALPSRSRFSNIQWQLLIKLLDICTDAVQDSLTGLMA